MIPIYPAGQNTTQQTQAPLEGSMTASGLTQSPPLSLYIHFPWCVEKCPYCDFNSHGLKADLPEDAYIDALIADLEAAVPMVWGRKLDSIFMGGGTPSLFSAAAIERLLNHVQMLIPLKYDAEITLEANPGTVDIAHFAGYRTAGVNRVSIGIQSFNDQHLKALGRIHDRTQAIQAVEAAKASFDQVNLDVMYALPDQTLAQAIADAKQATALSPTHLSFYHLTIEPNTAFYQSVPKNLPEDDASAEMQIAIEAELAKQGYIQYETSAFATEGNQCRHNLNYWTFGDYLGIGAGAHSKLSFHDKIMRQRRHQHPKQYQRETMAGNAVAESNVIQRKDLSFEFMMNAMRLIDGVPISLFQARTGLPLVSIQKTITQAIEKGLLEQTQTHLKPSPLGQRFLNELLGLFLKD